MPARLYSLDVGPKSPSNRHLCRMCSIFKKILPQSDRESAVPVTAPNPLAQTEQVGIALHADPRPPPAISRFMPIRVRHRPSRASCRSASATGHLALHADPRPPPAVSRFMPIRVRHRPSRASCRSASATGRLALHADPRPPPAVSRFMPTRVLHRPSRASCRPASSTGRLAPFTMDYSSGLCPSANSPTEVSLR